MRREQIVGRVFAHGDIKVVALAGRDKGKHQLVEFECRRRSSETGKVCGKRHVCRFSSLKSGAQTSCGCGKRERVQRTIDKLVARIFEGSGIEGNRGIAESSQELGYQAAARKHGLGKLGPYIASSITKSIRGHDRAMKLQFLEEHDWLADRIPRVIAQTAKASSFGEPYRAAGTFTSDEIIFTRKGSIAGELAGLVRDVRDAKADLRELRDATGEVSKIATLIEELESVLSATIRHRRVLRKWHAKNKPAASHEAKHPQGMIAKQTPAPSEPHPPSPGSC